MSKQTKKMSPVSGTATWGGAREGAGRPRKTIATKTISVRVNTIMHARMETAAERADLKLTDWVRAVLFTAAIKYPPKS